VLLLILSIHTIIDVLENLGWLPEWIDRRLHKKREATMQHTLESIGVTPKIPWVKSVNQALDIKSEIALPEAHPELKERLRNIVSKYIESHRFTIGSTSRIPVKYFINLRHAFCAAPKDEIDKQLAEIMLAHIKECFKRNSLSASAVVARKNGLNILGYLVARAMGLPLLLYTEDVSIWCAENGKDGSIHPRHIDYNLPKFSTAIIVDDSCVGGGSFKDLADDLRKHGINIEHAFVLFTRKEVDAVQSLRSHGLTLHPLDSYSDAELSQLYAAQ
jgi:orotate phosphoribosyltransferase